MINIHDVYGWYVRWPRVNLSSRLELIYRNEVVNVLLFFCWLYCMLEVLLVWRKSIYVILMVATKSMARRHILELIWGMYWIITYTFIIIELVILQGIHFLPIRKQQSHHMGPFPVLQGKRHQAYSSSTTKVLLFWTQCTLARKSA